MVCFQLSASHQFIFTSQSRPCLIHREPFRHRGGYRDLKIELENDPKEQTGGSELHSPAAASTNGDQIKCTHPPLYKNAGLNNTHTHRVNKSHSRTWNVWWGLETLSSLEMRHNVRRKKSQNGFSLVYPAVKYKRFPPSRKTDRRERLSFFLLCRFFTLA